MLQIGFNFYFLQLVVLAFPVVLTLKKGRNPVTAVAKKKTMIKPNGVKCINGA